MASGLVVVDKPSGLTSHQVVGRARKLFGIRKIGHAGTLDPMATGVLILGVDKATRLLGHLALHDKRYLATIRLGAATTTDDAEGEITGGSPADAVSVDAVRQALASYRGDIEQVPSSVSAIKVDGKRAYARVREGESVELKARPVTITRYDLLAARPQGDFLDLDVDVECSSGTYIRALARDLGADLGVGGHLTSLRRTRIGGFSLDGAVDLFAGDEPPALIPMARAARLSMPVIELDAEQAARVRVGGSLQVSVVADPTGVIGPDGELLALYRPDPERPGQARAVAVLV